MQYALHILISIALWLPVSLGYTFLFGKGKILHFGPIGTAVVTAYAIEIARSGSGSLLVGLLAGIAAASLCSLLCAWIALRLTPDGLGVLTIALHLMALAVVLNWSSLTGGARGIARIPRPEGFESAGAFAALAVCVALAWIAFFVWLDRTRLARRLQALAESEWTAAALGVDRAGTYAVAFFLLGLTIVSDNVFFPQFLHLLHPNDYQFPSFVTLLLIVVAGRPGSIWGAVVATALVLLLREGLRFLALPPELVGPVRLLLFGVILFAAVWVRRDAVFPRQRSV